jgi:flagellar hook protein FlgE
MQMTSLWNGLSGVKGHTSAIQSVSDNLANINSPGFKHTRMNFEDLLSAQLHNGTPVAGPTTDQIGNAAQVFAQNIMMQGDLTYTDNSTDLAINGHGFYRVSDPHTGDYFYTRAGNFVVDREGYMVLPSGHRLQGFAVDDQGVAVPGVFEDIQIPLEDVQQQATSRVSLAMNLDAAATTTFPMVTAIDPTSPSTYNYAYTTQVYDEESGIHNITMYYQKINDYSGLRPTDSVSVWRVNVYETTTGTPVANPPAPENDFYMHFDTNGHLVGLSGPGYPTGAEWAVEGSAVAGATSDVSNRVGETFGYTGDGAAQTFISSQTATLGGSWGAGDTFTLTVGGTPTVYDQATYATAQDLANAINQNAAASGIYVDYNAGADTLTFNGTGASQASLAFSDATVTVTSNTLQDIVDAVNNGAAATGSIFLDLSDPAWNQGDAVTVGGNTYVWDDPAVPGAPAGTTFQTIWDLDMALTGSGYTTNVFGSLTTGSISIQAPAVGSAANADTLSTTSAGTFVASSATLTGGMDGTAVTDVAASVGPVYDTSDPPVLLGQGLHLDRANDVGATATIAIAGGTLGANLATPLNFGTATETQAASAGSAWARDEGDIEFAFEFDVVDEEGTVTQVTQNITYDYWAEYDPTIPDTPYSGSTQSAGSNETWFLEQDGSAAGYLDNINVAENGVIWGFYSNQEEIPLSAIGLTDFIAPAELRRLSNNLWGETVAAGEPIVGQPADAELGLGEIESGALENSTVDLATEFVKMINYQRAFQANSKTITTSDDMLKTALSLKT